MKNKIQNFQTDISSSDGKDWDETEEVEVKVTIETDTGKRVFKGKAKLGVRINRIQ